MEDFIDVHTICGAADGAIFSALNGTARDFAQHFLAAGLGEKTDRIPSGGTGAELARVADGVASGERRPDAVATSAGMTTRPPVVRLIDDDPEMCKSLKWVLETVSLEVEAYSSFLEFEKQTDLARPGCVILDLMLRGEDGIAVMEQLSSRPDFHLPVIILTGHGDVTAAVRCMKLGAMDFFQKPVKSETLIAKVRDAIDFDIARCRELDSIEAARRRIRSLSPREREVVDLIGRGFSSKQIATKLGLSIKTVVNRRARAMAKVAASNAPELVKIVIDGRLGDPPL